MKILLSPSDSLHLLSVEEEAEAYLISLEPLSISPIYVYVNSLVLRLPDFVLS